MTTTSTVHRTLKGKAGKTDDPQDLVRTEVLNEQEYLVAPVIALVEGVLWPSNAEFAELALADEFGKWPAAWDGRPVTVNHPQVNSESVSANSPGMWESVVIGQMFNTKLAGDKLKSEVWINKAEAERKGFEDIPKALEEGRLYEVSTGLFAEVEAASGTFHGEKYNGVWRNIVPDHLAILPNMVGACSVADGCGTPRANSSGCQCGGIGGGTCDACKQRQGNRQMSECQCEGKGGQAATVENVGNSTSTETAPQAENSEPAMKASQGLVSSLRLMWDTFANKVGLKTNSETISDSDIRAALLAALEQESQYFYGAIVAIFDSSFIYEMYTDGRWSMLKRSYSVAESGPVTLGSDAKEVRPVTSFVDMEIQANSAQGDSGSPVTNSSTGNSVETSLGENTMGQEASVQAQEPVTLQSYIDSAPEAIKVQLKENLQFCDSHKAAMIKQLAAAEGNQFSEDELKAMSLPVLEKMLALAKKPVAQPAAQPTTQAQTTDFSGAAPAPVTNQEKEPNFTPPPQVFPLKRARA